MIAMSDAIEPVIDVRGLTKTFDRRFVAVNALNLQVQRGTVYGLIGRNGAGKTTTLRLLMGLLKPDSGSAKLLGYDFWLAPSEARERVVYVSQQQHLPDWMTLEDIDRYCRHFYSLWDSGRARALASRWDLPWERPLVRFSAGNQRLAALIGALAAHPEVLLLDEPAAGLDPVSRQSVLSTLAEALAEGFPSTLVLSTHQMGDLERLATHVGILDHGRMLMEGTIETWQSTMRRVQVVFEGAAPPDGFAVPGALRSTVLGPVVTAVTRISDPAQLDGVRQLPKARVFVFPLSLEDLFVELLQPGAPLEQFGQPVTDSASDRLKSVGQGSYAHAAPAERERDV
jgi:ABC-2 type transport system ATP-binding protein